MFRKYKRFTLKKEMMMMFMFAGNATLFSMIFKNIWSTRSNMITSRFVLLYKLAMLVFYDFFICFY